MNRRDTLKGLLVAPLGLLIEKPKKRPVWVSCLVGPSTSSLYCPFCNDLIGLIEEGGLYPRTMYCRKQKKGFKKFKNVRSVSRLKREVEYTYES
jgi:hypothetical protein